MLSKSLYGFSPVIWVYFVLDVMVLVFRSPKLKMNIV